MISIAPLTPPRMPVTSPAKATARFRPSERVRSIAASLVAMIEAPAITHIAAMIMMPTAMISPVIIRARRRGSLVGGVNMLRFLWPDVSFEHSVVNNRLKQFLRHHQLREWIDLHLASGKTAALRRPAASPDFSLRSACREKAWRPRVVGLRHPHDDRDLARLRRAIGPPPRSPDTTDATVLTA